MVGNDRSKQPTKHHKRLLKLVRSTPWFDWNEFHDVGKSLLSVSSNIKSEDALNMTVEQAMERVAVWKTRSSTLPHAIESTAALAKMIWRDRHESSQTTTTELRYGYSCVVLRTINGLADVMQQNRAVAASVAFLCAKIGIPSWLVDIRHESTHQQLPTLPILRMASNTLMEYLKDVFWDALKKQQESDSQQARDLLYQYYRITRSETPTQKRANTIDENEDDIESSSDEEQEADCSDKSKPAEDPWSDPFSLLGSSFNRFSILRELMSSSSSKKKRKQQEEQQQEEQQQEEQQQKEQQQEEQQKEQQQQQQENSKKAKRRRIQKQAKFEEKPDDTHSIARKLLKLEIPLGMLYEEILCFLVGNVDVNDAPCRQPPSENTSMPYAVLFPKKAGSDDHFATFESLREMYDPLLVIVGKSYPGFLASLLVYTVHKLINKEKMLQTTKDESSFQQNQIPLLELWIQYFVSRSFISNFDTTEKKNLKDKNSFPLTSAALKSLVLCRFPLNALCDKCEAAASRIESSKCNEESNCSQNTTKRIANLFQEILGEHRQGNFGIAKDLADKQKPEPELSIKQRRNNEKPPLKLSLKEIEAMLGHPDTTNSDIKKEEEEAGSCCPDSQKTEEEKCASNGSPEIHDQSKDSVSLETFEALLLQGEKLKDSKQSIREKESSIRPRQPQTWTKCASWDPCSIGELPATLGKYM